MRKLMAKRFTKGAAKQNIPSGCLTAALSEVVKETYEVNLGGTIDKKRIRFEGRGKAGAEERSFATKRTIGPFCAWLRKK